MGSHLTGTLHTVAGVQQVESGTVYNINHAGGTGVLAAVSAGGAGRQMTQRWISGQKRKFNYMGGSGGAGADQTLANGASGSGSSGL